MQIVYSETTQAFSKKCYYICRDILGRDVKIILKRKRFIFQGYSYPLHIVVFEKGTKLGYFNSNLMEIGIAKTLMFSEDNLLQEVIQHELAHLLCFLRYGDSVQPHGREFREICDEYGWKQAKSATVPVEIVEKKTSKLQNKILKLFDLASSSNVHEAKSALNKARELMISHGINILDKSDEHVVMRVMESKRVNEKMRSISEILRAFFVYPVINHGSKVVYLEIFGEARHVEIANYIAAGLERKMEELWKKETSLKGTRAKNSFLQGLAGGFITQINKNKHERGVLVIEKALAKHAEIAYPHLRSARSSRQLDTGALEKGHKAGSKMKIPKGVKKSSLLALLPMRKKS